MPGPSHQKTCQGHTGHHARATSRENIPESSHRGPCQGHDTRLSARATAQDTMPVPSQEKTHQGHHTRKHGKAITGEIVSGPSHEKACQTHQPRPPHEKPAPHRKHIRAITPRGPLWVGHRTHLVGGSIKQAYIVRGQHGIEHTSWGKV